MRKIRIAFINTHPIQYFAPLYTYLNQIEDFSITAIYLSDYSIRGSKDHGFGQDVKWDIDLLEGYEPCFLPGAEARDEVKGYFSIVAPDLWSAIQSGDFDAVVIHGHTPAAMLVAIAACRAKGIPVFMRCDTHLNVRRSQARRAIRKVAMNAFYRSLNGFLAVGTANAEFYRAMGVAERRIFLMPYAVDNARFKLASQLTALERTALRASFGVEDDRPIALFAAKLQMRKRPDDLLKAAAQLQQRGSAFHLLFIGSGEMEMELRSTAERMGIRNIHFGGFVNQAALPRIYAACDVFVLPSEDEPWGLAINEAMSVGLPIVAAAEVGCVADLVHDGINGRTFRAGDIAGLTEALSHLIDDRDSRRRMGLASLDIICRWSYAECATGLKAALAGVGLAQAA